MTGAVAIAAVVGLLSLLSGVALGWYLRRTNNWCQSCGDQLACEGCGAGATWAKQQAQKPQAASPGRY